LDKHPAILIIGFFLITALAIVVAFSGGHNGSEVTFFVSQFKVQLSVFLLCAVLVFLINWVAYIPAVLAKTEHYYDLVGSISYLVVIGTAILLVPRLDWRALMVSVMVVVWALRLGAFLFLRVRRNGTDDRFDEVKVDPLKFLVAWTLQALWVLLSVACALVVITNDNHKPLGIVGAFGALLWCFGFTVEVIADHQKYTFRKNSKNIGEIMLWFGMALIAVPVFEGWQWVAVISPLSIYLLLTKGSGIPTLEEKAQAKWGANHKYQQYQKNTGLLFPSIPKR